EVEDLESDKIEKEGKSSQNILNFGQINTNFNSNQATVTSSYSSSLSNSTSQQEITADKYKLSLEIYTKGSPEVIRKLCKKETLPDDFDQQLQTYTQQGLRIIALANKEIKEDLLGIQIDENNKENNNNKSSTSDLINSIEYEQLRKLPRDQCESNLTFLGFLVLENRLRPTTKPAIKRLQDAGIRCVMVTGDNVLTAVNIARQCNIIPTKKYVKQIKDEEEVKKKYVRKDKDNKNMKNKDKNDQKNKNINKLKVRNPIFIHIKLNIQPPSVFLCVTSDDGSNVEWKSNDYPDWKLNPDTLCPVYQPQEKKLIRGINDEDQQSKLHRSESFHQLGSLIDKKNKEEENLNEIGMKKSISLPIINISKSSSKLDIKKENSIKAEQEKDIKVDELQENQKDSPNSFQVSPPITGKEPNSKSYPNSKSDSDNEKEQEQ
ncbi:MAG: putative cation-transporting ATPase 13A2, partial [Streblomastix strix]